MTTSRLVDSRRDGSVLVFGVLALVLVGAFAGATLFVAQKSSAQQRFFATHTELYAYAESGIHLALHDIRYGSYGSDGNLGTLNWTVAGDVGQDGKALTGDAGEADGFPTPGEPNVFPLPIGRARSNASFITYVDDVLAFPGVQRIVSTATDGETMVTVEHYTRRLPIPIPITGALYASPNVVLDLIGNKFIVDGNDHNVDGSPGPNPPLSGIATSEGTVPGENADNILLQIPEKNQDQIIGEGGTPSVEEVTDFDFDAVFEGFKSASGTQLTTGTYTDFSGGDWDTQDFQVTSAEGDVHLSGDATGAGVLVVDGTLTISGNLEFVGLVIVRGDLVIVGGGSAVQVYGSVMVDQTLTAVQPKADVTIAGNADVFYSSEALAAVGDNLLGDYGLVYYDEPAVYSGTTSTESTPAPEEESTSTDTDG